jgi:hypothetical protein
LRRYHGRHTKGQNWIEVLTNYFLHGRYSIYDGLWRCLYFLNFSPNHEIQEFAKNYVFHLWKFRNVFFFNTLHSLAPLRYYQWIFVISFQNWYYNTLGAWLCFMWNLRISCRNMVLLTKFLDFVIFGTRDLMHNGEKLNKFYHLHKLSYPIVHAENNLSKLQFNFDHFIWPILTLLGSISFMQEYPSIYNKIFYLVIFLRLGRDGSVVELVTGKLWLWVPLVLDAFTLWRYLE